MKEDDKPQALTSQDLPNFDMPFSVRITFWGDNIVFNMVDIITSTQTKTKEPDIFLHTEGGTIREKNGSRCKYMYMYITSQYVDNVPLAIPYLLFFALDVPLDNLQE